MENNMQIQIKDIKIILEVLIKNFEDIDTNIDLDKDMYWNISEDIYNVYETPTELTLGSLIEDWEFLQMVINGKREMIDYDLSKLSNILKFLNYKMVLQKNSKLL